MRTFLPFLLTGTACLLTAGLVSPGRAEDDHASHRSLSTQPGRIAAPPAVLASAPPVTPYRSAFFFPEEPPANPRPYEVRDVSLMDNYFSPSLLYVQAGMTVRWTNRGRHQHSTTADWLWESGAVRRGESFSVTFTRPGTYYYYCRLHPRDMRGVIVVY